MKEGTAGAQCFHSRSKVAATGWGLETMGMSKSYAFEKWRISHWRSSIKILDWLLSPRSLVTLCYCSTFAHFRGMASQQRWPCIYEVHICGAYMWRRDAIPVRRMWYNARASQVSCWRIAVHRRVVRVVGQLTAVYIFFSLFVRSTNTRKSSLAGIDQIVVVSPSTGWRIPSSRFIFTFPWNT